MSDILTQFSSAWPEERIDYRRPEDDSWKVYGTALRDLVAAGVAADAEAAASPAAGAADAEEGLGQANRQVRALCARALGYLQAASAVDRLGETLSRDPWETTRLLAADSLGMIFSNQAREYLHQAQEKEKQDDVRLHIDIALKRDHGLEAEAVEELLKIRTETAGIAAVGEKAPEFSLETCTGRTVSLSEFRERRALLVFIYGDG